MVAEGGHELVSRKKILISLEHSLGKSGNYMLHLNSFDLMIKKWYN